MFIKILAFYLLVVCCVLFYKSTNNNLTSDFLQCIAFYIPITILIIYVLYM